MKTQPAQGVVLLLVERLSAEPGSTTWTCVDPLRRVQIINVKKRPELTTKAARGVNYTSIPQFSAAEKLEIEHLSRDLVLRSMRGESVTGMTRIVKPVPEKGPAKARATRASVLWNVSVD